MALRELSLRAGTIVFLLCAQAVGAGPKWRADQGPVDITIDSQGLDFALNEWARQTGYSVLIPYENGTKERVSPTVMGKFTPETALVKLLSPSGLQYEFVNAKTIAIRAASTGTDRPAAQYA